MTNPTPGYARQIPQNLVEMAHEETGQWLNREDLETWVFRRFQRLDQRIKILEEEHEAKVRQNVQLMRERDQCRAAEEAQIALRAKMEQQNHEWAALLATLQEAAADLISASNEEEAGDAAERIEACSVEDARKVIESRDALKQLEALDRLKQLLEDTHFNKAPSVSRLVMQVNDAINRVKQEVTPIKLVSSVEEY